MQPGTDVISGNWEGAFNGVGSLESKGFSCKVGAPAAFGGSGQGANPSSLLLAAANGCFLLTLAGVLQKQGVRTVHISLETRGAYRGFAPPELGAITHQVKVVVDAQSAARIPELGGCFEAAKAACTATRAMPNVRFRVEGEIVSET